MARRAHPLHRRQWPNCLRLFRPPQPRPARVLRHPAMAGSEDATAPAAMVVDARVEKAKRVVSRAKPAKAGRRVRSANPAKFVNPANLVRCEKARKHLRATMPDAVVLTSVMAIVRRECQNPGRRNSMTMSYPPKAPMLARCLRPLLARKSRVVDASRVDRPSNPASRCRPNSTCRAAWLLMPPSMKA